MCQDGKAHDLATYVHTDEDGNTREIAYCVKCGGEW